MVETLERGKLLVMPPQRAWEANLHEDSCVCRVVWAPEHVCRSRRFLLLRMSDHLNDCAALADMLAWKQCEFESDGLCVLAGYLAGPHLGRGLQEPDPANIRRFPWAASGRPQGSSDDGG